MKSRLYKPMYSVPDAVLDKLVDLLRSWGLKERDWLLETENAAQRFGYWFIDRHSPKEIDVGVRRVALPWKTRTVEWTCVPPLGSRWFKDYERFVRNTGYHPHIVAYPFGPFHVSYITQSPWYTLPSGHRMHLRTPVSYIRARHTLLFHPTTRDSFRSRIPCWKQETGQFLLVAERKKDKALVRACEELLAVCQRLEQGESHSVSGAVTNFKGTGIGKGVLRGYVRIVKKRSDFLRFERGKILVAEDTNPIFVPLMRKAKAIITDRGGLTSHAATLAREFKVPAVIGTKVASKALKSGDFVEVNVKIGVVKKLRN